MTLADLLTKEQQKKMRQSAHRPEEPTIMERLTRPVTNAVYVTPEQLRQLNGLADEPQGRGWHRERSRERIG